MYLLIQVRVYTPSPSYKMCEYISPLAQVELEFSSSSNKITAVNVNIMSD